MAISAKAPLRVAAVERPRCSGVINEFRPDRGAEKPCRFLASYVAHLPLNKMKFVCGNHARAYVSLESIK